MSKPLHGAAGALALVCIAGFWLSTLVSELFLATAQVVVVKNAILTAMWVLVPAMALTGASGFALARGRQGRLVAQKAARMRWIAGNGLLVLLPCAFVLAARANAGRFDTTFYTVQAIELAAGAVNLVLIVRNVRDGLRLSGRLAPRRPA